MPKSIIVEGKTTNEAISNGLKKLNVSKEMVDIKVLDSTEKRSFFNILTPRIVKIEMTLKEGKDVDYTAKEDKYNKKSEEQNSRLGTKLEGKKASQADYLKAKENVQTFLKSFCENFTDLSYEVSIEEDFLKIEINGEGASKLIGYRGEVLNSLQIILNSIANKGCDNKIRIILNIGNYKEKREKALEELADKISKTVLKTGKSITLEPMVAYERKIIHNRLQSNKNVRTYSIGEEPYRKVVVAKNYKN